ncbi:MAG: tryptophan-rich sensory protein [Betaproteobacteria bacterium]|nr:MAG: tryptophan-rich sensory protein [Betaproteobacteria bacterium]
MSNGVPRQILGFLLWLTITAAAAALGSLASLQASEFYRELMRPDWAPAPGLFGPVWTLLYLSMALAAWLVWRERGARDTRLALSLFLAQLVANALWSWLFFAWHLGLAALADIVLLWILIVATLVAFWWIRRLAGVVLIPYLVWVTFAALLNLRVWQLNPGLLS